MRVLFKLAPLERRGSDTQLIARKKSRPGQKQADGQLNDMPTARQDKHAQSGPYLGNDARCGDVLQQEENGTKSGNKRREDIGEGRKGNQCEV